jgi:hypothetical protein
MESTSVELEGISALLVAALWGFSDRGSFGATGHFRIYGFHH